MPAEEIKLDDKEIILIGTAHVSRQSVEEVRLAIPTYKPDVVAVELCQARFAVLKDPDLWKNTDIIKVIKEKKATLLFANLVMASFQRRIGDKIGIRPGEEIKTAIEVADATGIPVALIDRNIRTTLQRLWWMLSLKERFILVWSSFSSIFVVEDISEDEIEKLKEKDTLTAAVDEIAGKISTVKRVLLDERDAYMAKKIMDLKYKRILAVVGAGHTKGLLARLKGPVGDESSLEYVPPKKRGIWKWVIPLVILFLVSLGFFCGGSTQGYEMIKWWLLCNAIFAATGACIALAHPITILVAAIASPITSLNPTLAAGWFAGLSEAYLKRPKVADFESLYEDISSVKGFWKNPITRILMIVILANIGSMMGALVAMPILTKIMLGG
ncbi:MAG: TraB/GumN family protein [Deltaproteobacteria bacterium]|nr:TraB/GumN family protein [Deltaproteobacteria bacterium]